MIINLPLLQWRQLAKELEGVVKIGAVNCQDSREVCLNLRGYPSLILFSESGNIFLDVRALA